MSRIQSVKPSTIPFQRVIAGSTKDDFSATIEPPLYARAPGFRYNLSTLLRTPAPLLFNANDESSSEHACDVLKASSPLDPSQADALIDCLMREVAMIEGYNRFSFFGAHKLLTSSSTLCSPPGTGKSWYVPLFSEGVPIYV